ncbi:GNAT family N-acetyltransferase [Flavobacterium sp.]|uniref:GNAT family N-acetyltransferase n=1 Tax=Flavobacterium sp. TaxID=239 RepID=UPI0025E1749B|nr:GNAT family N-acetyltransferase [Flavobacterium sp.]
MLVFNFAPFPNLETNRLNLRRLTSADVNEILALRSNPEIMKFIPRPLMKTKEEALEFISVMDTNVNNNNVINWAITTKEDDRLIGMIGFYRMKPENYRAEVGYILSAEFHGKGIITEALERVIQFGFEEMGLNSIEAVIDPENFGSEKVLLKNNFVKEGHFKEHTFFEGKFLDSVFYSLLKKNY